MNLRYLLYSIATGTSLVLACVLAVYSVNSSNEQDGTGILDHPLPISAKWASGEVTILLTYTMYLPLVSVDDNLLKNGDFESPPPWPMQNELGEIQVAPNWRAWYLDSPPSYVQVPFNCASNPPPGCYWIRPEFRDAAAANSPQKVHSGSYAQWYFSFGRMHEAGLYQQVSDITPGSRLSFSVYMKAWMCSSYVQCNGGLHSDAPTDMHLRIGIAPTGGTNPLGQDVIWSPESSAWDTWAHFQVETVALSNTVTIFTHSRAEWDYARMNNDVYIDDARLVVAP